MTTSPPRADEPAQHADPPPGGDPAPPGPDHPDSIPVVDLSAAYRPESRAAVAAAVLAALRGVGAFHATGTLILPEHVSAVADAFRPFFEDWTEEQRAAYAAGDDDHGGRGYLARFAAGDEDDKDNEKPDQLRSFVWHPYDPTLGLVPLSNLPQVSRPQDRSRDAWRHPNLVPDGLPGARAALRVLAALFSAVRAEVLALLEEAAGWEPGRLASWMGHGPLETVAVNHYQLTSGHRAGAVCLKPHTDFGALTLNALDGHSGVAGLWYRGPSGQWHPAAEPPPGGVPIFAGRLLAAQVGLRAFEHFVRCGDGPAGGPNRMSVVGFGQPAVPALVTTAEGDTRPSGEYYAEQIGRARFVADGGPVAAPAE